MGNSLLVKTLDLLKTLVEFDTRSEVSNLELIAFVRNYLAGLGVESFLIYAPDGERANLFATIGPSERRGLCLSGHTDVVPADPRQWTVEPFTLTSCGDRVMGRGTADMKGFLASVLARVPYFIQQRREMPIHLAFSYDEEIGCRGVRNLLAELSDAPFKPLACVIGEPTGMRVAVSHKGKRSCRCRVQGLTGHSALPHLGVNAVEFAVELATFLRRTGQAIATRGIFDDRFDPPYSTLHIGKLSGGIALNVIPNYAELEFEIRHLPNDDPDPIIRSVQLFAESELVQTMQRVGSETGIVWEELTSYPALADVPGAAWLRQLACDLTGDSTLHTLSFGTEGGLFQEAGIPTIVCGPGSIAQAHKADEYLELEQLERCLSFLSNIPVQFPNSLGELTNPRF